MITMPHVRTSSITCSAAFAVLVVLISFASACSSNASTGSPRLTASVVMSSQSPTQPAEATVTATVTEVAPTPSAATSPAATPSPTQAGGGIVSIYISSPTLCLTGTPAQQDPIPLPPRPAPRPGDVFTLTGTNGVVIGVAPPSARVPGGGVLSSCNLLAAAVLDPVPNPPIVTVTDTTSGTSWPPTDLRQGLITADEVSQISLYGDVRQPGWIVNLSYVQR